jgi:hypothetical protein
MFLPSWWPERRSLLLHNETAGGNWLQFAASMAAQPKTSNPSSSHPSSRPINRQRIGTRIEIYLPGRLGEPAALLGCRELSVGFGYASAQPAIAHFGLGKQATVDVRLAAPHGGDVREIRDVRGNQRLAIEP